MSRAVDSGSFRDPAGFVFRHQSQLYRQINKKGKEDFEYLTDSGLYGELQDKKLLISHRLIQSVAVFGDDPKRHAVIKPTPVPFISYPYEWTFSQLKAAALLTLEVQRRALARGMILKDASAYNIQYIGKEPILIDSLSFKKYQDGAPWEGYKQFCEHFIAPLALASYTSPTVLRTLQVFLDGIPLALATTQLPRRARFNRGLLAHLFLHGASQKRYQSANTGSSKRRKVSMLAQNGLLASLERTTKRLNLRQQITEWGDYYNFTNYSEAAFRAKQKVVSNMLTKISPKTKIVWDLGANDGTFSLLAAARGAYTVAFDIDPVAVERNFKTKENDPSDLLILPLVQDFINPSPALGWAHRERQSLLQRGPADVVLALALLHHLAIGNNVPLPRVADFLAELARHLIIEFIPKSDSMVQRLLASRQDIFDDYTQAGFEAAFKRRFGLINKQTVRGSQRTIYLYRLK